MLPVNNKIVVSVDKDQKKIIKVDGDISLFTANSYEPNYRYKSPSIATVVEGNKFVKSGDVLLCHHNLFYLPSPYHLTADLFSIPFSSVLFAKIDIDGNLDPICGNMIVEEIEVESEIELPPELKTNYKNRYKVLLPGWTEYKPGQIIFTRPSSGYQIVYHFNDIQKIATKVFSEMICGVLK